MYISI